MYESDEDVETEDYKEPLRMYTQPDALQFLREVKAAGFQPEHYFGRSMWEGPSIVVDDLQDGIRATTVKVQWDRLGDRFIVYPLQRDAGT